MQFLETMPTKFNRFKSRFIYPCAIAIKFSPLIDYKLKFVKMQFLVIKINITLTNLRIQIYAI